MTAVEIPAGPADKKWERAKWPAGPIWDRLAAAGVGEGDLAKMTPPIYLKSNRARLTTGLVDAVCCRVLAVHPFDVYGPAWFDDVTGQEEFEWAS